MSSKLETHLYKIPGYAQSGFWRWVSIDWHTDIPIAELDRLKSMGWDIVLPTGSQFADTFALLSHLAPSLMIFAQSAPNDFTKSGLWVMSKDFQFAEQYPVILTHQVNIAIDISDEELKDIEPPEKMLAGTEALIYSKTSEEIHLYHLENLGEPGKQLQATMQYGIAPLAKSSEILALSKKDQIRLRNENWQQAKHAARELAQLYWQYHLDQQTNTKASVIQRIPEVFPKQLKQNILTLSVSIPTSLALRGVLNGFSNAQSGASRWTQTDQKVSYLYEHSSDSALIEWRPEKTDIADRVELGQRLWRQVNQLSDLDGDVLLACMAQWIAHRDKESFAWISSELILSYRGIQPRKFVDAQGIERPSTHRWEDLQSIENCIEHIRQTHVSIQQWISAPRQPGQRGRPKKKLLKLESYILTISDFLDQYNIDESGKKVQVGWRFQPGQCITFFLEGSNHQVAQLVQQTLAYDPTHELWEKRLARFLMFQLQLTQDTHITCTIGELMDELSFSINSTNPEKTKRRFEKALHRLQMDQQIAAWEYQVEMESLPSKKWVNAWRAYQICITASPLFATHEAIRLGPVPKKKKKKEE